MPDKTPAQWPIGASPDGEQTPGFTTYRLPGGIALRRALSPAEVSAALQNRVMTNRVVDAYGQVWQGPGAPAQPQAPAGEQPRQFDYLANWNVWRQPATAKTTEGGIDFSILRAFATQPLVRLAIETVKDLDAQTEYLFTLKPLPGEKARQVKQRAMNDPRIAEVSDFFESPDGIHDFADWRRMAWEEALICDNLSVYKRNFAYGKGRPPYSLRLIDGDTIEPMIDDAGYEPEGDAIAYEQWIKGSPRTPFTVNELLYQKFNPRVKFVFGHSPTEQALSYINILIRRDSRKLAEYTDGNIPAALWSAPDDWTPSQIQEAQLWLDSYLSGDPASRSKLIFVPGGSRQPVFPGERQLADPFDDLLTRLICYAYNVSVSSLLREQNRATAQVTRAQAEEEGVAIRRKKMARFLTRCIRWAFGYNDIIAIAKADADTDAEKQARIDQIYLQTGVRQPNEIRERDGEEPIPTLENVYGFFNPKGGFQTFEASIAAGEAAAVMAAQPAPGDGTDPEGDGNGGGAPAPKKKNGKQQQAAAKSVAKRTTQRTVKMRRTDLLDKHQAQLAPKVAKFFRSQAKKIAAKVVGQYEFLHKDSTSDIVGTVTIDWSDLARLIEPQLEDIYIETAQEIADELGVDPFDELNQRAADYAHERAAELVGKKWIGGALVDNPDAKWAITDTTRNEIRKAVERAFRDGNSPSELADEIVGLVDDEARADMIARTELAMSQSAGTLAEWDASGVVSGKEWLMSNLHDQDDVCDENADDGVIPADEVFSSGDDAPPAHPNCECDVAASVDEEALAAAVASGTLRKRAPRAVVVNGQRVAKFNPNHDEKGRFTFSSDGPKDGSASATGATSNTTAAGGGAATSSSSTNPADVVVPGDKEKFLALKQQWAEVNNQLLKYVDDPNSPEAQQLTDQLRGIVKQMYTLHADSGSPNDIGLPGGPRDMVVVGAGPGGMAASIMGGTDGLDTLLVDANQTVGGQSQWSSRIENYPGFPIGVTGRQLAETMYEQAQRVGADTLLGVRVTGMQYNPETGIKTLTLSNGQTVEARAVVVAGGIEFRHLDFAGNSMPGVIYADAKRLSEMTTGKEAVIIGGSNGAAQAALGVAQKAEHVTVLSRSPIEKGMSDYQVQALRANPRITVVEGDEVSKLENSLNGGYTLTTKGGRTIPTSGLGVFVGGKSDTSWLPSDLKVKDGKVTVDRNMETSIPGVFAVGDIRTGGMGRVGAAVGDGQIATKSVHGFLEKLGHMRAHHAHGGRRTHGGS